jgi:predicted site-specific integrase-resolvase
MQTEKRFLTRADVGQVFGRSSMTLWRWERAGLLKPVRILGKPYYRAEDIEALAQHGDAAREGGEAA